MKVKRLGHILCLLLCCCVTANWVQAQDGLIAPVYGWHAYTSHKVVIEVSVMGDTAYVATGGGVILHRISTSENTILGTPEGLSSVDPTAILADRVSRKVFIGYKDGTIDYMEPDGDIHVITDISRNNQFSSRRINHLVVRDGLLYIAADFGIVVYDIGRGETKFSVTKIGDNETGTVVNAVAVAQGKLWASLNGLGVWAVDAQLENPLPAAWTQVTGTDGLSDGTSSYICANNDTLYAQVDDTIFTKVPTQAWTRTGWPEKDWNYLNAANGNVYATYRRYGLLLRYRDGNTIQDSSFGKLMCVAVSESGDAMLGDSLFGLQRIRFGVGQSDVGPDCPRNNNVEDVAAFNGEFYIAAKGRAGSSARAFDKSGIAYHDLHNGGWDVIDHRDGTLNDVYQDFYTGVIDSVTGRAFVGSWGEGIVELLHGEFVRDYNSSNSGLSLGISGHLVSGLQFDAAGNLWITQALNDSPLQCLTPSGQWYSYSPPFGLDGFGLTLDELGNKWILAGDGIAVFNDNFSPENPADDQWRKITKDFGNGGLPNNSVYTIVQDHDLQIWIGTSEGITIMYDPSLLWTDDFQDAACPIIDGFCLFRDQQVNDIAVDGYNRKWVATENGAFLVNLDGTEVLQHFTRANSPLLDDDVRSVDIDPRTGEVFFGTAKGLIGYIGDAIDGRGSADALYAYPNPAFVNQETPVMVKGMASFSTVKVTTVDGRLVRQLDSQGGEVPWDLHDAWGSRVTPGIYLILVADPDGKVAGVTKLAILEQQN